MKTKAEKSHASKPQIARAESRSLSRKGGFFIPSAVQTKLTVNKPDDPFEREADAMADRTVSGNVPLEQEESQSLRLKPEGKEELKRREDPEEEENVEIQRSAVRGEEEVQRQCADCEEEEHIQRSSTGESSSHVAPSIVNQVVAGGGDPLESGTRSFMESRFGRDFSHVRIHKDSRAHLSAKAISAQAYTYGPHIAFARGKYQPHTAGGRHLLAHELAHVVQQGQTVRRFVANGPPAPSAVVAPLDRLEGPAPLLVADPVEHATGPVVPELPEEDLLATEALPESVSPAVELDPLMPPPPDELGEAANTRLRQATRNSHEAAENNATLPTADQFTQEAREGVTEPAEETSARASGELTSLLAERPAPSPEIDALCETIRRVIREKRPPDEDSLLQADFEEAANEAGAQLNDNLQTDIDRVEGQYDELDETPAGEAEQIGEPVETPPEQVGSPDINAVGAAPDPLTEEEVSLEADVQASATQLEQVGMRTEVAEVVQDGPVAEARAAHGELEQTAAEDPAVVLAEQDMALDIARSDMESLQEQALAALEASRSRTVTGGGVQQTEMVASEEAQRQALGIQAENIFSAAQDQVNLLLEPLTRTAMTMWETGKERIATEFEQHLARVQRWVDERHSGFGGGLVELWDDWTGMPDWVTDEYDDAERRFGNSVCELIREISTYVNGVILTCERLIDNANREIDELFAAAPAELQEWATEQRGIFQERLDGLREQVQNTQQRFNEDLANRAVQAVQEVREQVHALREAAKGLLGRIANAIADFLEDPLRAIINGLLSLVGIDPSAFWALVSRIGEVISDIVHDPVGFAGNLLSAIGAGFQRFFDNVLTHLYEGFINWLFSGLGAVGVEVPRDFSLGSIITFFLQLMGITWERIRNLLARHIGEENVALLEQAIEIVSDLIELGPTGIFELIKDQLDPQHILDTVIQMAVDFIKEILMTQAAIRIVALFNPVGAIAQAIEAIYKVLKWIFENAARIFSLVETVVNGMADIIAGNIAGMAAAVESALARLLVPVIDFIAEFMSLGDLPNKVAEAVRGLQNWVEGILDRVIGWLAERARSILSALGISEDDDPEETEEAAEELEDTEVGEVTFFTALGERHRLWIDNSGSRVRVMMASTTQEVGQTLSLLEDSADNGVEENAAELVDQAQLQLNLLIEQAQITSDLIREAANDEQPVREEVDAAQEADEITESLLADLAIDMGEAIEAASVQPFPEKAFFNPEQFTNDIHPAQFLEAREVVKGNHEDGSSPQAGTLVEAWEILEKFGLNGPWVRFHIFNHKIGGKGLNSNLIPTPRIINSNYLIFENKMKIYHDNQTPVWFMATINYYSNNPWFVEDYRAVGGGMKYENGEWVEAADKIIPEFKTRPGLPEPLIIDINAILRDDVLMWNTVSNLTPISVRILRTLQRYMPSGGYTDLDQLRSILDVELKDSSYKTQIMSAIGRLNFIFE